jgi:N utilization substance protein A
VADELTRVPGVTTQMMVTFGENEIKTIEDLADCATDDLLGWTERKEDGEPEQHAGILDGTEFGRKEVEDLIMAARIEAGWIKAEDLIEPEPEPEAEVDGETADDALTDDAISIGKVFGDIAKPAG